MKVEILESNTIPTIIKAIRVCYDSVSDSKIVNNEFVLGCQDLNLINRVIKNGHLSTMEHYYLIYLVEWEHEAEKKLILDSTLELSLETSGLHISVVDTGILVSANIRNILEFSTNNYVANIIKERAMAECDLIPILTK